MNNLPIKCFAQLLLGFQLAEIDHRVVAVNLVLPEDGLVAERDYDLHMQMISYLHAQYPRAHISLHAGELSSALAKPSDMLFHINHAVTIGKAQRIGHGVDIQNERNADQLAALMAKKRHCG